MGYRNGEHYADPTAGAAMDRIRREQREERRAGPGAEWKAETVSEAEIHAAEAYMRRGRMLEEQIENKVRMMAHLDTIAKEMRGWIVRKDLSDQAQNLTKMEDAVLQLDELKEELGENLCQFVHAWREIAGVIRRVKSPKYRLLLEKKYLRDMKNEEIAAEMKKSPRYVYLIRREALAVVYRILEQDGKVA